MKKDYKKIKEYCEKESKISANVIDEFLMDYAAYKFKLEKEMNVKFGKYTQLTSKFPNELNNRLKAQYIIHRIFKQDGLIGKLINHSELQRLTSDEMAFLKRIAKQKWRFSFSIMLDNPAEDFFLMDDIFTGEKYLLYSKGTSSFQESQATSVWFNLITDNGHCCVSYGPIAAFKSFLPHDIFFFATELNNSLENNIEVSNNIEKNPIPYMMLISGANIPPAVNNNNYILSHLTEYDAKNLDTTKIGDEFKKEYNNGVYRLSYTKYDKHPHFSMAYYDENLKIILLTAQTKKGYVALVEALNRYGFGYELNAAIIVSYSMLHTTSEILQRKVILNEYDSFFAKEPKPEEKEALKDMNAALNEIMPIINQKKRPDVIAIAKKYNVDADSLQGLVDEIIGKLGS